MVHQRKKPFSGKKKKMQLQAKRQQEEQAESKAKEKRDLTSKWEPRGQLLERPLENSSYSDPISFVGQEGLHVDFPDDGFFDIPTRPSWSYAMSKEQVEEQERRYFKSWLDSIYKSASADQLGYFEQNLQVWRQLWRVCEMSATLVVVVDIRHPVLHFPPSLCRYIEQLQKRMVLVLMKADLVPLETADMWAAWLKARFPRLTIKACSCYGDGEQRYINSDGVSDLKELFRDHETVGFIGHPNVGKSSLINSIVGRKVVSASRTPGHTKHFQTIMLTGSIRLVDCPGLIFPTINVSREMQTVNGLYNSASVRDPYAAVALAMKYVDLSKMFSIESERYSVMDLCESKAKHL